MRTFEIHTQEIVHGVYVTTATSAEEAKEKFNDGQLFKPILYEALSASVESVVEEDTHD